jgi:peptidoglycan/LPS O-acetylase OafA/YrhL
MDRMNKERDFAIDIMNFLAVLLIINSHADVMYPHLKMLATGGAIGDCLFLFCSGFTLFRGGKNLLIAIIKSV